MGEEEGRPRKTSRRCVSPISERCDPSSGMRVRGHAGSRKQQPDQLRKTADFRGWVVDYGCPSGAFSLQAYYHVQKQSNGTSPS